MKITIVTSFFLPVPPLLGGSTEKSWAGLAKLFAARGQAVTLISRRWPGLPDDETADGVRHLRLPGFAHRRSLALNLLLEAAWSARVLRRLPAADITVANSITLPILIGSRKRRCGRLVVPLGRMPKGQLRFYRHVDRLLAASMAVLARVHLTAPPALGARARLWTYPIDWRLLHAAAHPTPLATDTAPPLVIGYAGRIHPEKGLDLLADAAARLAQRTDLPPWELRFVGPVDVPAGGAGARYRDTLATRLGSRAMWSPPVFDDAALAAHYRSFDIFCYPSVAESGETFGVAIAEAMAAGAVPVVSSLECFQPLVRSEHNGLVFDHRSSDAAGALAATLARLLTQPALRTTLAARAQADTASLDFATNADALLADFATLTSSV